MMKRVLFLCLISFSSFAYEYQISIASVFNNEARFLKEWIEFHRLIGVEHFYLYNHNSSDNFQEVLSPYIKEGIVELFHWEQKVSVRKDFIKLHNAVLRDAVLKTQGVSKWVAFIDTDEFIFPIKDKTLPKFLSRFEDYPAVTLNWKVFGTSKVSRLNPRKLMLEQLTHRAADDFAVNNFVKSIVQVKYVDTKKEFVIHTFPLVQGKSAVNADKKEIRYPTFYDNSRPVRDIRINHYILRDEDFLHNTKLKRVAATDPRKRHEIMLQAEFTNQIKDRSILTYGKALRKAMRK